MKLGIVRAFSRHEFWSNAETDRLVAMYATASRSDLVLAFPNRKLRTIQCKAYSLGLRREKKLKRSNAEYLKAKRESMARARAAYPERELQRQRDWNNKNRSHVRLKVRTYHRRRFFWAKACRLRGEGPGAATYLELAAKWKSQRGLCALTGDRLNRGNAELDHILPKARGGGGQISNLRWVTKVANRAKRDMTDEEFFAMCRNVVRIQMVEDAT